jgi:hypothetical protein
LRAAVPGSGIDHPAGTDVLALLRGDPMPAEANGVIRASDRAPGGIRLQPAR